jgi:hypothetical protein
MLLLDTITVAHNATNVSGVPLVLLAVQNELLKKLKEYMQVKFDQLVESGFSPHCIYMTGLRFSSIPMNGTLAATVQYRAYIEVYGIPPDSIPVWHDIGTTSVSSMEQETKAGLRWFRREYTSRSSLVRGMPWEDTDDE